MGSHPTNLPQNTINAQVNSTSTAASGGRITQEMNDFVLPVHDTSKLKYLFYHLFTYSSYYIIIRLYHYILLNIVFFYSPTTLKIHQSLSLPITISFHRHPLTTNHQNYHHQSTINLPSTILSSSISTNSHLQSPTYLIAVFIVSHNLMFFVL